PLLPGTPTAMTVVTSRQRIDGLAARDGAALVTLDALSEEQSILLLASTTGLASDSAEVAALGQLCAGLPLALRVASAQLTSGAFASPARLISELRNEHRRLSGLSTVDGDAAVRGAFAASWRRLSQGAGAAFGVFGVHPGPSLSVEVCAAALDVDVDHARAAV